VFWWVDRRRIGGGGGGGGGRVDGFGERKKRKGEEEL
jgi:hypothetical protein